MSDLRNQLDAAMGDPPRSTVDLDAIVRRQRRAGRLRVAGAGGATAAVLAGAVAGAIALTGAPAPSGVDTASPSPSAAGSAPAPRPTATATPTPRPRPTSCPPGTRPSVEQGFPGPPLPPGRAGELTAALQTAVRAETKATRLYPYDDKGAVRQPLRFHGGPCDPEERFRGAYFALAKFGPRLLDPLVDVSVKTSALLSVCSADDTVADAGTVRPCERHTGPGGELIESRVQRGEFQSLRQVQAEVVITKGDGTVVQLRAVIQGRDTGQPPLSVAQLIRIGLAPGLTLDL